MKQSAPQSRGRRLQRILFPIFMTGLLALGGGIATVHSSGVAELSLDRGAVRGLLAAAVAEPLRVPILDWGEVTIDISPPDTVTFNDGGVEAELQLVLRELELNVKLQVRYEPQVDSKDGTIRLVATQALPGVILPVEIDLAALLPVAELPRRLSWDLKQPGGRSLPVQALIQGLIITEDRLTIQLGLPAQAGRQNRP